MIEKKDILMRVWLLAITTFVFLVGIKLMGSSFKLMGNSFAEQLISFTTSPLVGLFIGILATTLVQSSSVSTSIIVGLTASGALTISGAIPMIMGANIGTTITNTIVSLGHITKKDEFKKAFEVATVHDFFNFIVVMILFPLEIYFHLLEKSAIFLTQLFLGSNFNLTFSSPLDLIIQPVANFLKSFLFENPILILVVALAMLFLSLRYFVKIMKPLAESEFKHLLNKHIFSRPLRSFGFGILLTIVVQSSSVSTSLLVPLAGVGILAIERIFPFVMGANIGTTITAFMASIVTGSPAAVTVALAHILFNVSGCLIIIPIRKIPIRLAGMLAAYSVKSRVYPLAYVLTTFFIGPLLIIFIFQ